ncbi:hypothetical protein GCM10010361_04360 [Streptomyces olivaceiscleroticus]|uniref:Uncharacterized protein n=1 Tax=Streptomyces olivaceiscleroticus TaxID=68245 RepID=A0ABP3J661_9ACTN
MSYVTTSSRQMLPPRRMPHSPSTSANAHGAATIRTQGAAPARGRSAAGRTFNAVPMTDS